MTLSQQLIALFEAAVASGASDIHVLVGEAPRVRVHGALILLPSQEELNLEAFESLLMPLFPAFTSKALLDGSRFAAEVLVPYGEHNFVVYVFRSGGAFSATVRILSAHVPTLSQVGYGCAQTFKDMAKTRAGVIVITGPFGSGKQTTALALLQEINATSPRRIHLLEESRSYRLLSDKGLVSSVLIGHDAKDYDAAIRSLIWHADPDVLYLADIPDTQTVLAALSAARTGHLVIANATAPSAAEALATLCRAVPTDSLDLLADHIVAVTNQRLMKKKTGSGRIPAYEVILNSVNLRDQIRSGMKKEDTILTESEEDYFRSIPDVIGDLITQDMITESEGRDALRDYALFSLR